jgi:hypothetical protein
MPTTSRFPKLSPTFIVFSSRVPISKQTVEPLNLRFLFLEPLDGDIRQ